MKRLLITGGTGGLGSIVAERLRRDFECVLLRADLTSDEEASRAVAAALADGRRAWALVHLVGGFASGGDAPAWSSMLSLNLMTAVNAFRAAAPHLEDGGRIVAIGAYASLTRPSGIEAYVVSKSAFNTLVQTTSEALRARRIAVNALLPATLDAALRERVAETIAFLLSEPAGSITGALIPVT